MTNRTLELMMNNLNKNESCPSLGQLFSQNGLFVLDLTLCSFWLLFCFHSWNWHFFYILPLLCAVLRIVTNMLLFRRNKVALIPIILLILALVNDCIELFSFRAPVGRTFLSIYDYLYVFFNQPDYYWPQADIYANHNIGNTILGMIFIGWLWTVVIPIAIYIWYSYKKMFRKIKVSWKKSVLVTLWVVVSIILSAFIASANNNTMICGMLILVVALPLICGRRFNVFTDPLWKRYGAFLLVFALAYVIGTKSFSDMSMLCIPLLTVAFYWLINKTVGRKVTYSEYAYIIAGAIFFYVAQYTFNLMRIGMLCISAILILAACARLYLSTRKVGLTIVAVIVCAKILPTMIIGYNQYAVTYASVVRTVTEVDDIYQGVYYVKGEFGYGIRDRYGIIIRPTCEFISPLNRNNTFFYAVSRGHTYIYDIRARRSKLIADSNCRLYDIGDGIYRIENYYSGKTIGYVKVPDNSFRFYEIQVLDKLPEEIPAEKLQEDCDRNV